MSSSVFEIKEHTLECQHIREYERATAHSQEDALKLAIKQYIPLDNPHPQPGDITIIGTHANGFPKELYEPFWEDLHARSKSNGFRIRSIWAADVAWQGASGVLNEQLVGNDPSWNDHARDLLHLVNAFRSEMPRPIIGIGHSLGANVLVNLSLIHPRLLNTLVLLDPVISQHASAPSGPNPTQLSTWRRDFWPSRAEAEASFLNSPFYQTWDKRVLQRWVRFGLRDTPTALFEKEKGVTLTTPKAQECFTFLRPSWEAFSADGSEVIKQELIPDMAPDSQISYPFYRPEPPNTYIRLGELRPSVLYVFGGISPMSSPEYIKAKMETTGAKTGGSGGAKKGRVKKRVLKGIGHLVAMEAAGQCAEAAAEWLQTETKRWEKERKAYEEWTKQSFVEKATLSDEWKRRMGKVERPPKGKL
ncbi:Alpha/beta hydrolase family-domain-containing protein [Bisporella sp. PMI_857]|nr:Alpha/beta hydrolase family-domain-containing protein [Bisporella sp. PMI_857]